MAPNRRKPRPGGIGRGFQNISVNSDNPEHSPQALRKQARPRRRRLHRKLLKACRS